MLIDCDTCTVRDLACEDCVVTVLLGSPPVDGSGPGVHLDSAERAAIAVLAGSGLVPPLRLAQSGQTTDTQRDRAPVRRASG